jgi:hypothetical protein
LFYHFDFDETLLFAHAFLVYRGCAHCGRGGSPVLGDGGFETRFRSMRFVNCTQRAHFRHPHEAFFYDLDGSLTGTGIAENYTRGGSVRGASLVPVSPLLPPTACTQSPWASGSGIGGAVCRGLVFRRVWHMPRTPSSWVGKALCVRPPWAAPGLACQDLNPACSCLPFLKKFWQGNVFMAAEGYRYNVQVKVLVCLV